MLKAMSKHVYLKRALYTCIDDVIFTQRLRNNPGNSKWFFTSKKSTFRQQKNFLRNEDNFYIIYDQEEQKRIGTVSAYNFREKSKSCEVGRICVSSPFRRKGYAYFGLIKLVNLLVKKQNVKKIFAYIKEDNEASRNLFKLCGFEEGKKIDEDKVEFIWSCK